MMTDAEAIGLLKDLAKQGHELAASFRSDAAASATINVPVAKLMQLCECLGAGAEAMKKIAEQAQSQSRAEVMEITPYEGGAWREFKPGQRNTPANTVHALKFADGSVWDCYGGWRRRTI